MSGDAHRDAVRPQMAQLKIVALPLAHREGRSPAAQAAVGFVRSRATEQRMSDATAPANGEQTGGRF